MIIIYMVSSARSPWGFPSLEANCIIDRNDKQHICLDFYKLEKHIVADAFPMLDCVGIISRLKVMCNYTTLDLSSGFWQTGLVP